MRRRARKVIVIASMMSLSILGSLNGGITSYAKGPGEKISTVSTIANQINITTYNKSVVAGLGNWQQQLDGNWKFKITVGDEYLTNSWIESLNEAGVWFYVNELGIMLANTKTPDGYLVDVDGVYKENTFTPNSNSDESSNEDSSNSANSNESSSNSGVNGYDDDEEFMKSLRDHELGIGSYDKQAWN